MKAFRLIGIALVLIVGACVAVLFTASATVDSHRGRIAEALTHKMGREVVFEGPLRLGLSPRRGFVLSVDQARLANPAWAKQPSLARVGHLELGLALMPLLRKEIAVTAFTLSDAEIAIETGPDGSSSLDFTLAGDEEKKSAGTVKPDKPSSAVAIDIKAADIRSSRLILRDAKGKTSDYFIQRLALTPEDKGSRLHYEGTLGGNAVSLDVVGEEAINRFFKSAWPFKVDLSYGNLSLQLYGTAHFADRRIEVGYYRLTGGKSIVTGDFTAAFGGDRPLIEGKVESALVDPSDLKPSTASVEGGASVAPKRQSQTQRVFSDEPLTLDGLKTVNAHFTISIDALSLGNATATKLAAKLILSDGRLMLSPLSFSIAGGELRGQAMLNAGDVQPSFSLLTRARGVELSQFLAMGGVESLVDGKSDMDLELSSNGKSLHDLASNANGQISLLVSGGEINTSEFKEILGSAFDALVMPVSKLLSDPAVHCGASRIQIVQGVAQMSGSLLDTSMATVYARGSANLGLETLNFHVATRGKILGTSGLVPSVKIAGTIAQPIVTTETSGMLQKVAGSFLGEGSAKGSADFVPEVGREEGANACLQAMLHPKAPAASASTGNSLIDGVKNKAKGLLNGMGGGVSSLIDGVGGEASLFGE